MIESLQGKKSYILASLIGVTVALYTLGWVPEGTANLILSILLPAMGVTIKIGQNRIEDKIDSVIRAGLS